VSDDPFADRRRLTFEQAEGVEALPMQLQPKEMPQPLRAALWAVVFDCLQTATITSSMGEGAWLKGDWSEILHDRHVHRLHKMSDDFDNSARRQISEIKSIFEKGAYHDILGFLQFVLRHRQCPYRFVERIDYALARGHAPYRVLDRTTIVPVASESERATLERAFVDLSVKEFHGARSHLRLAASELTEGNYAASVRESIHAVESVARTIEPAGLLGEALNKLEKSAAIHPALKRGFSSIYGYTNDKQGIRHPLLDDPHAEVDEADALFMIGACASFVSYMIHKARLAGLLSPK
jgi:hypothetical protein